MGTSSTMCRWRRLRELEVAVANPHATADHAGACEPFEGPDCWRGWLRGRSDDPRLVPMHGLTLVPLDCLGRLDEAQEIPLERQQRLLHLVGRHVKELAPRVHEVHTA